MDQWLAMLDLPTSNVPDYREAICTLGSNSAPVFARALATRDDAWLDRAGSWLDTHTGNRWHHPSAAERRRQAAWFFFVARPSGAAAVPTLGSMLRDNSLDSEARLHVIVALAVIGPASAPAAKDLVHLLETEKDVNLRAQAARALAAGGAEPAIVVPALCRALEGTNNHLICYAAYALGHYGSNAIPALPRLRALGADRGSSAAAPAQPRDLPEVVRSVIQSAVREIEKSGLPERRP